ncbi:MAG: ferredoxin [Klenkia sp.]|nr:ferredoxin [Klenkia sp.]
MNTAPEQVGGRRSSISDGPFTVVLRRTGATRTVPADRSLLEVVEEVVDVPSTCRTGDCGSCVSTVLEGVVDHRNTVLSLRARTAGRRVALCVDRSLTPVLVVDL